MRVEVKNNSRWHKACCIEKRGVPHAVTVANEKMALSPRK
jgi:hypothetical protein